MHAEFVCGPPGSGKTTYCEGRRQYLTMQGRKVITLNMDPANDGIFPYPCDIDIVDLIEHQQVMVEEKLGPNGAYLFCMEYIALHTDWIVEQVRKFVRIRAEEVNFHPPTQGGKPHSSSSYGMGTGSASAPPIWLLVDCPGQVEYYLHSRGMHTFIDSIQRTLRFTVCVIHLCDAAVATRDVSTYVSTCLLALSTMTDLELPHLNVLTKWDTVVATERPERTERTDGQPELFHGGGTKAYEDVEPYLDTPTFLMDHFRRLWREQYGRSAELETERANVSHGAGKSSSTSASQKDDFEDKTKGGKKAIHPIDRRAKLAKALLEVVDGYNLVSFVPLDVQDGQLMGALGEQIDAAVGYLY
jgi:hypothetical protein